MRESFDFDEYDNLPLSTLEGKTLTKIELIKGKLGEFDNKDRLIFTSEDGQIYEMSHDQNCCEAVSIENIEGSLKDLTGSPITLAKESSNSKYVDYDYEKFSSTMDILHNSHRKRLR